MSGKGIPSSYSLNTFRNLKGPIIDIRSPKEYIQGHWPGAKNIPLFNNDERDLIGKAYKRQGKEKAIMLGIKLVSPKLRTLKNKLKIVSSNTSNSFLRIYCWRGGMRSASLGWFANLLQLNPILLEGGYKSYRKWALNQFEKEWPLRLLGGKTGTGKTSLLLELREMGISIIDLEGIANHKGSSFGGLGVNLQPTSEQFENILAQKLYETESITPKGIWLEAESANLGKCRIPNKLFLQMKTAPLIEIKRSKKERVKTLVNEYSSNNKIDLQNATLRIRKRLGPQRTKKALDSINESLWEEACLAILEYYDKCYEFELEKKIKKASIDISGMSNKDSAKQLIELGLVY